MRLLLDENLPKRLKRDLTGHIAFTVSDKQWNGVLLNLMIREGFEVLITFDKNLQYQQNFEKYPIPVIILNARDNTYLTLSKMAHKVLEIIEANPKPGGHIISDSL